MARCVLLVCLGASLAFGPAFAQMDDSANECEAAFGALRDCYVSLGREHPMCARQAEVTRRTCTREGRPRTSPPTSSPARANPATVASIEGLSTSGGTVSFTLALDTTDTRPFRLLDVGFVSLEPWSIEVSDIQFSAGLLNYVADNGEPPTCDIVIYPAADGYFGAETKLELVEPYDSAIYGTEYLIVDLAVTAPVPTDTTIQLFAYRDVVHDEWRCRGCDAVNVALSPVEFVRYDANDDGTLDISDPVSILRGLFLTAAPLSTECGVDGSADTLTCGLYPCAES